LPLGADGLGRDVTLTLRHAGSNLLIPLTIALVLPLTIGALLGAWVGSAHDCWRTGVSHLLDLLEALPKLVVLLAAFWVLEVDSLHLQRMLPLAGALYTPMVFYAVRERTRLLTSEGAIEAQRALGSGPLRILGWHVLWLNCRGPVLVQAALLVAYLLATDLSLAYLGYSQPDDDLLTLGRLVHTGLSEASDQRAANNPWLRDAPLLAVVLLTATAWAWSEWLARTGRES
jgi:peptide/nickel transport system permease protein